MTARTYGQFCGLARAMEIIGERWSLLVIRDLVLGPKRFTDLQRGLPKIARSILSARLNELEEAGVVRRRVLPDLDAAVVYELTEYGSELDRILLQLGLWGARSLGEPAADDVFTPDAAILSLYTTFRPEAALGTALTVEIRHSAELIVHARIDNGAIKADRGPCADADLVIKPRGMAMLLLLNGGLSAAEALAGGHVGIEGPAQHLETFTRLFHIAAAPARPEGLVVH
ncbi:winged helix-turn-helix transcriptional regulator [Amycolatopsis suaedae]|uniref:Transcriptional regulator n=1 Tax=Amycolatopsis suaedae TaxID=2510978 RepID=A0A4Q7J3E6_9PSEU|nr:helix-turn-helix domain-containing protein [Amycolatopsis suaedae]RZQ61142.1 transcriptional regulator [Amycolatopsis suaedae]